MDLSDAPAPALPTTRRTARPTRRGRTVLALAVVLPLAACGLRLETPPPAEPSPDALEQVRGRTAEDALDLAADAETLVATAPDGPARAVLADVAAFSTLHAEAAGGRYESGLPDPTPSPSATATATSAPDVAGLLAELVDDAAVAAADADAVADGPLARLVASVATSRDELADRLAAATGLPRPTPAGGAGTPDAEPSPAATSPAPTDPGAGASATGTATPGTDDAGAPGAEPGALATLALAHDEAAYGYEVVAARRSDDARAQAAEAAARHRLDADAWARAAGVAGRPADPRRAAYALPPGLDDPAVLDDLVRRLESGVADAYAAATAAADAGARADLVSGLREAHATATARGAAPIPFPGVPELATTTTG